MNPVKITQIALLSAALTIGLLNPVYNGLTLLALGMTALTGYLGYRFRGTTETPAA
ncbi:hypothetical protein [Arthrobacter caoxuetaonis]|uniref:Uncharacterized protein n=1 Tax=Arthrobacter caoxuetaonis TaxID=2886935 RepID=A0A9X1MIB4_9MICC|nr:hypothetical protein [Arthrobacter caoxuetaonis]MCC3299810.1 hypothetical protein [Arthrobacter caoxuetaonis]USQ59290.1 hypothetical protein NF551_17040 [Arthrobacter caoxuetaonis]